MFGDQDEGSVFERLSGSLWDRVAFIAPVRIYRRPEALCITDYRPTGTMLFTAAGVLSIVAASVLLFFRFDIAWASGLLAVAAPGIVCAIFLFRSTLREVYYFDKTKDTYVFVRQFIHRKELIEGAMSQFTGAYVKTETDDESESYFVVLKQEGMLLAGVGEQTLREVVPIFNSFEQEAEIANAIEEFLVSKLPVKEEL
jgi:hypothetical protein